LTQRRSSEGSNVTEPPKSTEVNRDGFKVIAASSLRGSLSFALQAAVLVHGIWLAFGIGNLEEYIRRNSLPPELRSSVFAWIIASALAGFVVSLILVKKRAISGHRLLGYARFSAPLPILANAPLLLDWKVWQGQQLTFLTASMGMTVLLTWALRMSLETLPTLLDGPFGRLRLSASKIRPASMLRSKHIATFVVVGASVAYAIYMSYYTIQYHLNGYTSSYDLGIEENIVWQSLHGGPLFKSSPIFGPDGTHFGRHATFIAFVIAPLYALSQNASTLLLIEATLVGAAAIPLYLFAKRRIGDIAASLVAISYLLHPGVHGAQLYDFHFLTLTPFFFWFLVLSVDRRWRLATVVFTILTLSIREDVAAGLSTLGCFLIVSGEAAWVGTTLALAGVAYFGVMKFHVMPEVEGPAFLWMFKGLIPAGTNKPGAIVQTIVANPLYTLSTTLTEHKLVYAIQMLLPTAFLSIRRVAPAIMLVPGIAFTLLVTQQNAHAASAPNQLSFQYTMHWIPYLYVGAVWVLGTLKKQRPMLEYRLALVAMVVGTLLVSYQYGAILQQNTARAGFDPFRFHGTPDRTAIRNARATLIERIPGSASVAASERLVPHLSNRNNAYGLRAGVFDAEWIMLSYGLPESRADDQANARKVLLDRSFGVVAISEPYILLKRGADANRNDEALMLIAHGGKGRSQ